MANSTIAVSELILHDHWPGVAIQDIPPSDSAGNVFTNATHHNVASPVYRAGTKVQVYDVTSEGYATLIYLNYNTGGTTGVLGSIAVPEAFLAADKYYDVTVDGDAIATDVQVQDIPFGIMLSGMTDTYYGWFWCGGLAPVDTTPLLTTTTVITQDTVAQGLAFSITDGGADPSDQPIFALCDANMGASGWSMTADA